MLVNKQFDVISLIFTLSAIAPEQHKVALSKLRSLLRPGEGVLIFRDYADGDLAQHRFKNRSKIRELYFVRQDGTLSYFFDEEEVEKTAKEAGLHTMCTRRVNRRIENRKEVKTMHRVFMQAESKQPF